MTNDAIDKEIANHSREITKLVERKAFNERNELAAGILATLERYAANARSAEIVLSAMDMTAKACGRRDVMNDALREVDAYVNTSLEYQDREAMQRNINQILRRYAERSRDE